MTIEAELPDGTILEFPDGTDQGVIQNVVKSRLGITADGQARPETEAVEQPSFADQVIGGLDAVAQVGTSVIAEPIAGLAGLITAPFAGHEEATKSIEAVRDFISVDATTKEGKQNLNAIAGLVNKGVELANIPVAGLAGIGALLSGEGHEAATAAISKAKDVGASQTLGDGVYEATGSPLAASMAYSLPTAALELIGVKGLKSPMMAGEKLSPDIAKAIIQAAPDLDVIKANKAKMYKKLDDAGIKIKASAYQRFVENLDKKTRRLGVNHILTPKSKAAMDELMSEIGTAKTPTEIDRLRRIARIAASDKVPDDARIGTIMVIEIDKALDSLSGSIGGDAKAARNLAQRGFKSQTIVDMIEDASHVASGLENGLRMEARKILRDKRKRRGFTADERTALNKIEQGTTLGNMAKFLGKFGISEGQATSMLGASIGIGGGGAIGSVFGPAGAAIGALTVPAVGQIAKKTAQRITLNNTKYAGDLFRAGKDARAITDAYLKHTPVNERRVSDLTDLYLQTDLSPSEIKRLPKSKTPAGKLVADSAFMVQEVLRKAGNVGSATLIASPDIKQPEEQ